MVVKAGQIVGAYTSLVNPGRPIPPAASGVHGIVDADVTDAPSFQQAVQWVNWLASKADALVARNAPFDRPMLPGLAEKPWLDTLRWSRLRYPDLESHTNGALRYALGLRCPEAAGMGAHRALADAYVTARLLLYLLEIEARAGEHPDLSSLIAAVEAPRLLTVCGFGKHKGLPWSEVPRDYLEWAHRNLADMDLDVRHTVEHYRGHPRRS